MDWLDNDGLAHFNVTRYLLKGKALCIFNDKAVEQKEETTRKSCSMSLSNYGTCVP
jgi:hypothetical protein